LASRTKEEDEEMNDNVTIREKQVTFSLRYLPEKYHDATKRYLKRGIAPGSLLGVCLENDLVRAWHYYETDFGDDIWSICKWIYWELPSDAWGSERRVIDWIRARQKEPYENVKWITE
jgi:hypothetical protein